MQWTALALFALLPLQWFVVGSTPLGTTRLHQLAILGFGVIICFRYRARLYSPVLRTAAVFVIANVYLLSMWAVVDLFNGTKPYGALQALLYLGAFVAIATFISRAASGKEPGVASALKWAAPVACTSVVLGFSLAMLVNGVNPASVLSKTIASADPELFQKEVFKSSFAGFGLDAERVQGNLRHEIFGSLLVSMLVSTWAMNFCGEVTTAQRRAYRIAMVTGTFLLALSLSRSILIAASVWPIIVFVRSLRLGQLSTRQIAIAFTAITAVGALILSGFGLVIWNRFTTDTTGYDSRAENYVGAVASLKDHWLTGGVQTSGVGDSSHNFIVDSWLRSGIFSAIPAAVVVVVLLVLWIALLSRLTVEPEWLVPVTVALALPLVRLGTSGGGLIPPIEWVALAFVFGVLCERRRRRRLHLPMKGASLATAVRQ